MIIIAFFTPLFLALFNSRLHDPGAGLFTKKEDAGRYDCVSASSEAVSREKSLSKSNSPRGSYFNESVFRCRTLFFGRGERAAAPDLILQNLDESLTGILNLAKQETPNAPVWGVYVQVFDVELASKIRFAIEVQLASLNEKVESEIPDISAMRIKELASESTEDSLEHFCQDLSSENKAWLGVGQLGEKESQLQGGVCYKGVWKWLL